MFSNKIAKMIQGLLDGITIPVYYIDQVPSFDLVKNKDGFVCWDCETSNPMHNTEGIEYAGSSIVLNFKLTVTAYASTMFLRNSIEKQILDILQPVSSGTRKPLRSMQLTDGFVRYLIWLSTDEFPIPKTAQSNAELSATVLVFDSSVSIVE
jgi:Zn-finger protein